jgi:hypothetical protein
MRKLERGGYAGQRLGASIGVPHMDLVLSTSRFRYPDSVPYSWGWRAKSDVTRRNKTLLVIVGGLLLAAAGQAKLSAQELRYAVSEEQTDYSQAQPYSPTDQVVRPMQPLNAGQLEQLVAPIALYPDALVAQVLAAATYPQQVAEADGWRQQMAGAPAEQVAAQADGQPWDPSVKALTAFPQVLAQMDRNLRWTSDLGNAYYNQPEDVLEAVQVMRRRARDAGTLQSTPQESVLYNQGYIQLVPPNPQVVYVPAYNPWMVYGEPMTPYPGFNLLGVLGDVLGAPLQYGIGMAVSAFTAPWGWLAWGLNWLGHELLFGDSAYYSRSNTVADWGFGHRGFHAYGGRGGFQRAGFGHSGFAHSGIHGAGWSHEGYGRGSFGRGNTFAGSRNGQWRSFAHNNTAAGNLGRGSGGFQSFRGAQRGLGGYGRSFGNGRSQYAANFSRGSSMRQGQYGNNWSSGRSTGRFSGSHFGSYGGGGTYRSSAMSTRHSGGSSWFGGHSPMGGHSQFGGHSERGSGGRSWGGSHFGGGGHAPKSFGGGRSRGFGGGHSGGGHSGGGGGSRHRR